MERTCNLHIREKKSSSGIVGAGGGTKAAISPSPSSPSQLFWWHLPKSFQNLNLSVQIHSYPLVMNFVGPQSVFPRLFCVNNISFAFLNNILPAFSSVAQRRSHLGVSPCLLLQLTIFAGFPAVEERYWERILFWAAATCTWLLLVRLVCCCCLRFTCLLLVRPVCCCCLRFTCAPSEASLQFEVYLFAPSGATFAVAVWGLPVCS